jgi:HEAT repeat protein
LLVYPYLKIAASLGSATVLSGSATARPSDIETLVREFKGESAPADRTVGELASAFARILDWFSEALTEADQEKVLAALDDFDRICLRAGRPGAESRRQALCESMVKRLNANTPRPVRLLFLKQLRFIGRAESVDALARLLDNRDPELREAARQALEHNPTPDAGTRLREALTRAPKPEWRIALVNAIAARRDRAAVGLLVDLLDDRDSALAGAAVYALGQIGGREAAEALAEAWRITGPDARLEIAHAMLTCAERSLEDEDRAAAKAALGNVAEDPAVPPHVRRAAQRRLAAVTGD